MTVQEERVSLCDKSILTQMVMNKTVQLKKKNMSLMFPTFESGRGECESNDRPKSYNDNNNDNGDNSTHHILLPLSSFINNSNSGSD